MGKNSSSGLPDFRVPLITALQPLEGADRIPEAEAAVPHAPGPPPALSPPHPPHPEADPVPALGPLRQGEGLPGFLVCETTARGRNEGSPDRKRPPPLHLQLVKIRVVTSVHASRSSHVSHEGALQDRWFETPPWNCFPRVQMRGEKNVPRLSHL